MFLYATSIGIVTVVDGCYSTKTFLTSVLACKAYTPVFCGLAMVMVIHFNFPPKVWMFYVQCSTVTGVR